MRQVDKGVVGSGEALNIVGHALNCTVELPKLLLQPAVAFCRILLHTRGVQCAAWCSVFRVVFSAVLANTLLQRVLGVGRGYW